MRKPLYTLTIIVVTLLVATAPVTAQQDISDLTTYTQIPASNTVNVVSPSEIRVEDNPADSYGAVYEQQDIDTYNSDILMEYNIELGSCGAGNVLGSGLLPKDEIIDGNSQGAIYGLRYECGVPNVMHNQPFGGFSDFGSIGTTPRHVEIFFDHSEAEMTTTIYESEAGSTVLYEHSTYYPAANNFTIAPMVTRGSGSSSDLANANLTDYSLTITEAGTPADDLSQYSVESTNNRLNVSPTWITINGAQADDVSKVYQDSGSGRESLTLEYQFVTSSDSTDGSDIFTGAGWKGIDDGDNDIVSSLVTISSGGGAPQFRQDVMYFGQSGTTSISTNTKYYVTQQIFAHNATAKTVLYSDEARTNAIATKTNVYPAGEPLDTIYAAATRTGGGGGEEYYGLIGHIDVKKSTQENAGPDLTTFTESDSPNKINVSKNWVSFESLSNANSFYVANQSGPGTGTAQLNFSFYFSDFSNSLIIVGWADTESTGVNSISNKIVMKTDGSGFHLTTSAGDHEFGSVSSGTSYYATLTKGATQAELSIYSDKERTSLVGETTAAYDDTMDYDVTYALGDYGSGSGGDTSSGNIHLGNEADFTAFPEDFTGNISLRISNWMKHGSTQTAVVRVTETGEIVTSETTITSGNTTVITISGNQLVATSDVSISQQVLITADYRSAQTTETVTVANRTVDNIAIMPPEQYAPTFIGVGEDQAKYGVGGEIQWVLLAVLIGSMASWIARNEYMGIGIIVFLIILFWAYGTVSLGIALVALFYGLFVGYQQRETPSRSDTNVGAGLR